MRLWHAERGAFEVRECAGSRWALVAPRSGALADFTTKKECQAALRRVMRALREDA